MKRTNFERRNELIAAGLLGAIIGGLGVLGHVNDQKAEDEARASDMAVLTEQVLLLHGDVSDICRSMPETSVLSSGLASDAKDIISDHTPPTMPTTTTGVTTSTTIESGSRDEQPLQTTTTQPTQPVPCP